MKKEDSDWLKDQTKKLLEPWLSIIKMYVTAYIAFGLFVAFVMAKCFPQAFPIVATVLVIIGLVILFGLLYLRRKFEHLLIARRADRQTRPTFAAASEESTENSPEDIH